MGLFKKKQPPAITQSKCPVEGCPFTCRDFITLKKHTDWKHPELAQSMESLRRQTNIYLPGQNIIQPHNKQVLNQTEKRGGE